MTANQINYAKHREEKRHNVISEAQKERDLAIGEKNAVTSFFNAETSRLGQQETARANREKEAINWFQSRETARHNQAQEQYNTDYLYEVSRHNQASEELGQSQLSESIRHNSISEQLTSQQQAELARHNLASEEETHRTNVRRENTEQQRVASSSYSSVISADAAKLNAETRVRELAESERHNRSQEAINYAQVSQSARQASAALQQAANSAYANVIRNNELAASIQRYGAAQEETNRHNLVVESQEASRIQNERKSVAIKHGELNVAQRHATVAERNATSNRMQAWSSIVNAGANAVSGIARSIIRR